jgi:hypothetical protein
VWPSFRHLEVLVIGGGENSWVGCESERSPWRSLGGGENSWVEGVRKVAWGTLGGGEREKER